MSDEPYRFAITRGTYNQFEIRSHGDFVQVRVPDSTLTVGSALLMAGALIRAAMGSALSYSDGITEKYLTDALNEGGQFLLGKGERLVRNLHTPERQNDYDRGYADGYALGHKHGFNQ